ncbi:VOC family protein [Cochleicola gelatinilyticus]|uniref:VOC domain-containing protein n=1 Tax=Cochleicola gelatinilyticus TaxID=1763537 RepID=A0A167HL14_9FLAO|nr:VOC family protein [Cochleicola gelatinilyticus]OAB78724.1 hypothetical protein ULVI_09080 [Cochleicola gelatinilyticus]
MRFDIFLEIESVEKTIAFYVNELKMFDFSHNFGNGNILLKHKKSSICLSTILKKSIDNPNANSFAIQVEDCKKEFERIKKIEFSNNSGISPFPNGNEFIEHPLGIMFYLKDPFGNEFSIFEDYYDFLGKDAKKY